MSSELTEIPQTIFVFPRVRFREGSSRKEKFSMGPITVLPDEDETWQSEFSRERPAWLKIFRGFADSLSDAEPAPARGSLIIADDDRWMEMHISRIVGVLFYLEGNVNGWRVPSEALAHVGFKLSDANSDAVEFLTKTHFLIEHADSLQLPPPLELRGIGSTFSLHLEKSMHQELVKRLVANPYDHLVVACYHLYRTQWANFLHSPHEQDFAAFCACLEAAMNVRSDYANNIAGGLADRYGQYPDLRNWIIGLYAERAVFNHGLTEPVDVNSDDYRIRALHQFRKRPQNWLVIREICSDVIHRTLEPYHLPVVQQMMKGINPADIMLRQLMLSDSTWSNVAKQLTQKASVEMLESLGEDEKDIWVDMAIAFDRDHDFQRATPPINTKRILNALRAVAAGAGLRAKAQRNESQEAACLSLYEAVKAEDLQQIGNWYADQHRRQKGHIAIETVDDALFAIAIHIASFSWHVDRSN